MEHPWYCMLLLLGSASLSLAQNTVCKLSYNGKPITDSQWTSEVSLTNLLGGEQLEDSRAVGQIVIEFDAADIESLGSDPDIVYLQSELNTDKTKFTITVGKDFPNYEANVKDQLNIAKRQLTASYLFVCSGGSLAVLNILIDLKDTNNHAPNFVNGGEDLCIRMPFPPGLTFSGLFEKPITIEDIDFSTKQMDLTLDSASQQYFSVQINYVNDVTWTADIVTIQELNFEEPFTITLTATDVSDETSSRSSQQTYTINIDTGNSSKDPSEFSQPL